MMETDLEGNRCMDIALVVSAVVFFMASWALVVLCGRLDGRALGATPERLRLPADGSGSGRTSRGVSRADCGLVT
jgi:hypothetical protein